MSAPISSATLLDDFVQLCALGGRFAGTSSEADACAFLERRLSEAIAGPVSTYAVNYDGWRRKSCTLRRVSYSQVEFPVHSLVWSRETPPGGLECEVIDLGRGAPEHFERNKDLIRDRIVLVRHEYMFSDRHIHRRRKYNWAKDRGAAAFLVANNLPGHGVVTGSSGRGGDTEIPAAGISAESAAALSMADGRRAVARLELSAERSPATARNLIAEIPGKGPEWVVLCAHYDGHDLAQSAMDNATGVAAVLEIARMLAPVVPSLRRGLRIALFTIEEWGLAGSREYVDALPESERAEIALVVNLDSIAGSPNLTALTSGFEEFGPFLTGVAGRRGTTLSLFNTIMANSDHANFVRHGVPAFRLVAGFNEPDSALRYVLTRHDTAGRVSPEMLTSATALAAEIVLHACASEGPIARHRSPAEVERIFAAIA